MNFGKETIMAAIVGFTLGLVAAWLVLSIPQFLPKKEAVITESLPETTSPPAVETFTLTVSEPENDVIVQSPKISVVGKTNSGTTVIISGPLADQVLEATGEGNFNTTLDLEEGSNEIQITAYNQSGSEKTETRTVNFTKEEF